MFHWEDRPPERLCKPEHWHEWKGMTHAELFEKYKDEVCAGYKMPDITELESILINEGPLPEEGEVVPQRDAIVCFDPYANNAMDVDLDAAGASAARGAS